MGSGLRRARQIAVLSILGSFACTEDDPKATSRQEVELGLGAVETLGRIVVSVHEPAHDDPGPGRVATLSVSGRIARFTGLDEAVVRSNTDLRLPADDLLEVGTCVRSDKLLAALTSPADEHEAFEPRELTLVDLGTLEIDVPGSRSVDVPYALVPDVLPYMSGVEYTATAELGSLVSASSRMIELRASGSPSAGIPPFIANAAIPSPLRLRAESVPIGTDGPRPRDAHEGLRLTWSPDPTATTGVIVLHLGSIATHEPPTEEVTCLVADTGEAVFRLATLREQGLSPVTERLGVRGTRARRIDLTPQGVRGTEFVVQAWDDTTVALP